jgi:hypothetical protein
MKLNRDKVRALARKLKAKAGVITNEDQMTTSPAQERRSQVLPAGSAWASKEQEEKATGDSDQTSLMQPTVFETRQGVPIPINRGSGLEEPYMTPQHRFCNTDPSTSSKETSDAGSGMVNYGYENTPDLGMHPYPYNPGQTETKDGVPVLLRKGKWSRTYDYHPENIVTHDDMSLEKIKKDEEKSSEQEIISEEVKPNTPRMVATSSDAESGNPTVSNCLTITIQGIPHIIDKETGKDYGSIFDFEKSPKSFAYQKNRPGQKIDDKVR